MCDRFSDPLLPSPSQLIREKKHNNFLLGVNVVVFLFSGSGSLIMGEGKPGTEKHTFQKPWFSNLMMFIGMFCLFMIRKWYKHEKITSKTNAPLWKIYVYCLGPSLCDCTASFLMFLGLLWIRVSIWQMVRGSIVIFAGFIRWWALKKKLRISFFFFSLISRHEWLGIFVVFIALVIVGCSSLGSNDDNTNSSVGLQILGIFLVMIAQIIQAGQTVIEEHLLQGIEIDSDFIVGCEGLWGLIYTGLIFMPIAQFLPGEEGKSLHEDTIDSFYMLYHSLPILLINISTIFLLLFLNYGSMNVTKYSNSVSRNILEPVRTFFVWILAVIIYYISNKKYLEGLNYMSIVELLGFMLLVCGLFVYYGVVKFKWSTYEEEEILQP